MNWLIKSDVTCKLNKLHSILHVYTKLLTEFYKYMCDQLHLAIIIVLTMCQGISFYQQYIVSEKRKRNVYFFLNTMALSVLIHCTKSLLRITAVLNFPDLPSAFWQKESWFLQQYVLFDGTSEMSPGWRSNPYLYTFRRLHVDHGADPQNKSSKQTVEVFHHNLLGFFAIKNFSQSGCGL